MNSAHYRGKEVHIYNEALSEKIVISGYDSEKFLQAILGEVDLVTFDPPALDSEYLETFKRSEEGVRLTAANGFELMLCGYEINSIRDHLEWQKSGHNTEVLMIQTFELEKMTAVFKSVFEDSEIELGLHWNDFEDIQMGLEPAQIFAADRTNLRPGVYYTNSQVVPLVEVVVQDDLINPRKGSVSWLHLIRTDNFAIKMTAESLLFAEEALRNEVQFKKIGMQQKFQAIAGCISCAKVKKR